MKDHGKSKRNGGGILAAEYNVGPRNICQTGTEALLGVARDKEIKRQRDKEGYDAM